jgi:uracil phosphoribosyltransferase
MLVRLVEGRRLGRPMPQTVGELVTALPRLASRVNHKTVRVLAAVAALESCARTQSSEEMPISTGVTDAIEVGDSC